MSGHLMAKSTILRLLRTSTTKPHSLLRPHQTTPSSPPPPYFSTKSDATRAPIPLVSWYLKTLASRPILTKSITSSLIYGAADFSSQTISSAGGEPAYDLARTSRMAGIGLLILGPALHFWFGFVSRVFPKRDVAATVKKLAMGQMVYGPVTTAVFLAVNAVLQGESGGEIMGRLKRDLVPTMVNGLVYWTVCDFVTLRYFPVNLLPLVSNSFSYVWTVYLTWMASKDKVKEATAC